ncbi:MAG: hypothetical protein JSR77_01715 [Planctomycetes bacterium]|nr:hypothetical protein [Planctomycetota bacterium]
MPTTLKKKGPSATGINAAASLDWEFAESDTRTLTHGIHRYSGKFIPQVARQAIELVTNPGELVLDLYCGSGTTLLEAAQCRRHSIGIDMNPLATMISRVKSSRLSLAESSSALAAVMETADILAAGQIGEPSLFGAGSSPGREESNDWRLSAPWYTKWFQPRVLQQLVALHASIATVTNVPARECALVAFSDILRRVSNAKGGYPNVMFDRNAGKKALPAPLFRNRLAEVLSAVDSLRDITDWIQPSVQDGDARSLPLESVSVDAIVTHPPYIGSIPYAEYGVLSLTWLGHDAKALDATLTGGKRQSRTVVDRFQADYFAMFAEAFRVLKRSRHMFVMVANPVVKGETVDLVAMSKVGAARVGFELAADAIRKGVNRRANKMAEEHLLFFLKP